MTCFEAVKWGAIIDPAKEPLTSIEWIYEEGLRDMVVHFGELSTASQSICGAENTEGIDRVVTQITAPLVSFYYNWSPLAK